MATALPMLSPKPVGYRCCFKATISRKPTSPACRRKHSRKLERSDQISRDRNTQVEPPLLHVVSREALDVNGRRFDANLWDPSLPPAEAALRAGRPPVSKCTRNRLDD